MTPTETSAPRILPVHAEDALFDSVFKLGESNKQVVGMLPRQAWRDYAEKGGLIAAVADDRPEQDVLGYAAFRVGVNRSDVALAHLVVRPGTRGRGIARLLVEWISERYRHTEGIRLRCRRDLPASTLWPRLGFVARGDIPGRGADGAWLTQWWRDHGHPDLLTWSGSPPSAVSVVVDANVFIELHVDPPDERAQRTRAIIASNEDRVQLLVTPELSNELNRRDDDGERSALLSRMSMYPAMNVSPGRVDQICQALTDHSGVPPKGDRDRSDLRHIAYASAVGAQVLLSWDERAVRRWAEAAHALYNLTVAKPAELDVVIDELESAPGYSPVALLGTGYSSREAVPADSATVHSFLNNALGERAKDFASRDHQLAFDRAEGAHRILVLDPADAPVALIGYSLGESVINVTLMRMHPSPLARTLASQLADKLRRTATKSNALVIRVFDEHIHPLFSEALIADGFQQVGRSYLGLSINALSTGDRAAVTIANAIANLRPEEQPAFAGVLDVASHLPESSSPTQFAHVERLLRPLRIIDAPLPSWLVPIRPNWSAQLFNYPPDLFGQLPSLGLSLEHVYYRHAGSGETAPARIIWWVSGSGGGQAIACSELSEVVDGIAADLYRRFSRLGVWAWSDVSSKGSDKQVRALRFINTEMFGNPVALKRIEHWYDLSLRLAYPVKIGPDVLNRILTEARR